ncbi:SdpI family protein [Spirosoma sp. SC4-14]|uniref:SdpI family protein n=1 Tax=Spirosoma sp. SC4-14 TaxID=3128900 RepID=UPI0030CA86B5
MKTKSTTAELLMVAPWLLAILYVASIWNQLPANMPIHYDASGNVNGWESKNVVGGAGLLLAVLLYLLFRYLPNLDPRGRLQSANYQKLRFVMMLFLAAILVTIFYLAIHQESSKSLLRPELALISLLIAAIGNYLTSIKPNFFVGIRTPWTLSSDAVWRKTHQLGGRLMVAGGLVGAVLALIVPMPYTVWAVVGIILIASLIPVVYSYVYFQREKNHQFN